MLKHAEQKPQVGQGPPAATIQGLPAGLGIVRDERVALVLADADRLPHGGARADE